MRTIVIVLFIALASAALAADGSGSLSDGSAKPGTIEKPGYNQFAPAYVNSPSDSRANILRDRFQAAFASLNSQIPSQVIIVAPANGSPVPGPVDDRNIEMAARQFLEVNRVVPARYDLALISKRFLLDRSWFVNFRKMVNGLPVENSTIGLAISPQGNVSLLWGVLDAGPTLLPRFLLSEETARDAALTGLEGSVTRTENLGKVIVPLYLEGRTEYRPAHKFMVGTDDPYAEWEVLVDAESGQILQRIDRVYYDLITGNVSGSIQPLTAYDDWEDRDFFHMDLDFSGYDPVTTDMDGNYSINTDNSNPLGVYVYFSGPFLRVMNDAGSESEIQAIVDPPAVFDVYWDDSNSIPPERDAWYSAVFVHNWIATLDPGLQVMDFPMVCNVNVDGTCNAFWSGWNRTINFYRAGGGCPNIAQIADVVYHEYGHGITDLQTRPQGPDGAMHEGFSDYLACTITNQPHVGLGFFGPDSYLRNLDNNNRYPDDWSGESHNDGLIIGGALWHTRAVLSPYPMGYTDSLWHFARYALTDNFESYFWAFVALDDDDGDMSNGTPNAAVIFHAFGDLHGIGPGTHVRITADTLLDTEDTTSSYPVNAAIAAICPLRADSVLLYYDNGSGYIPIQMAQNESTWTGSIPPQRNNTHVNYYIFVVDQGGFRGTAPVGAPDAHYTFYVGPDIIPPAMSLVEGPPNTVNLFGPYGPFVITASDINGINPSEVDLHYFVNSEPQNVAALSPTANEGEYALDSIDLGRQLVTGDVVNYYFTAQDRAHVPNASRLPQNGAFQLLMTTSEIFETFEVTGMDRWTYDEGWGLRLDGANHAIWFSNPSYPDNANALITMNFDFDLSPYPGARLILLRTLLIRSGDTCFVEASNDGGNTWTRVGAMSGVVAPRFEPIEFDISSLLNPNAHHYKARFHFISDAMLNWVGAMIDDVGWSVDPTVGVAEQVVPLPSELELSQNYPNPFNPETNISFSLPARSNVRLEVFDLLGRRLNVLADGEMNPGAYTVKWNGADQAGNPVASGIYFYRLTTDRGVRQEKMTLLR